MTMNNSFYGRLNTASADFIQYDPSNATKLRAPKNKKQTVSLGKGMNAQPETGKDYMKTSDVAGYIDLTGNEEPSDGGGISRWGSETRTADDSAIESVNGSLENEHRENSNEPALEDCSQGSTVVSYNSPHEPGISGSHLRDDEETTRDRESSHPHHNDEVDTVHPAKSSPTMNIQSPEGGNDSIAVETPTLQTTSGTSSTSKRRRSLGEESNNCIHRTGGKRRRKADTGSLQRAKVDTNCEYEVESIRTMRVTEDGRRQYQVDWSRDLRWYDEADLRNCPLKIREFHERNPERPPPSVEL